jgi:hypothetical protein
MGARCEMLSEFEHVGCIERGLSEIKNYSLVLARRKRSLKRSCEYSTRAPRARVACFSTIMATSPIQMDTKQENQTWSRPDDQSATVSAPPTNGDAPAANGTGYHSGDHHDVKQPSEAAGYERANSSAPDGPSTSPTKSDAPQRGEKQIKVLLESYFLIAVTPVLVLSWHSHKIVSMLSEPCLSWLSYFCVPL